MINRKWFATLGAAALSTSLGGCAGFEPPDILKPEIADVRPILKGRTDDAVAKFDRDRNATLFTAAEALWRQGDYERCRESLDKILERDPNHRDSLLLAADVSLELDHPEEAVETLRRLAAVDPEDAEAAYRLGLALEAAGKVDEALPYLRQAVEHDPTNPKYTAAVPDAERLLAEMGEEAKDAAESEFVAALAQWEAGRDDVAVRLITGFLATHPHHVEANILMAEIDLAGGRDDLALQRMDRLAVRYPENPQICRATGLMMQSLGKTAAAEHCFAEARRLTRQGAVVPASFEASAPQPPQLGGLESNASNTARDEAGARLRAVVERGADDPQAALAASVEALKLEQSELAFELATAGVKRFPRSAGLHRVRGMAAYRLGRYAEAEASLRQSISLDNSQALSYFLLGSALDRLGKTEQAERYRSEAARLDSRYASRK